MTNLSALDYLENYTVSKSLNDGMWKLNFTLDKEDAPTAMTGVRAFGTDHNSVEHCLFVGFIPGAEYIHQSANNKVSITAYDFTWYLSAQNLSKQFWETRIAHLEWTPGFVIWMLLGGANALNVTGLKFADSGATGDDAWFYWGPETTKQKAIYEMADHYGRIMWTSFDQYGSVYAPTFHFDFNSNLCLYMPALVTFTSPSDYVTSVNINTNEMENYNRVTVYGQEQYTGYPYEKSLYTAGVAGEEEKPIDYVFVDSTLDSQSKVNAKCLTLYNALNGISSATYTAILTNRYDLKLLQLVKFVGYSDIPETNMRIISITYNRQINNDSVSIAFTADQSFENLQLLARCMSNDLIQTQKQVVNEAIMGLANISVGEVTAVDTNVATVTLERSGNSIKARILS